MRKSALRRKNYRNSSAHNLAVVKADPAVVKVAQVKAGQVLVGLDKAVQVRAVDLAVAVKVVAAALAEVAASDRLIL